METSWKLEMNQLSWLCIKNEYLDNTQHFKSAAFRKTDSTQCSTPQTLNLHPHPFKDEY